MAALGMLTACSDDPEGPGLKEIKLTADESTIVKGQQELAFELFDKVKSQASTSENSLLSPLSAYTDLSMIANGMGGQSQSDICSFIHISPSQIDELNSLNNRLINDLPRLDNKVKIKIANALWHNPVMDLQKEYSSVIRSYYKGDTYKADFSTEDGQNSFNRWVSNSTDGMVDKINLPGNTAIALANSITFDGKWAVPFNQESTKTRIFRNGVGENQFVPTMFGDNKACVLTEGFSVVRLPYGNGIYRMTLLLPDDETKSLSAVAFGYDQWRRISQSLDVSKFRANILLPRFKVATNRDLRHDFMIMKDTEAFSIKPDLSVMTSYPNISIGFIYHYTAIEVNEEATHASSSTVGGGVSTIPSVPGFVEFNRPFFYVIDEASTGAILFIGALNKI